MNAEEIEAAAIPFDAVAPRDWPWANFAPVEVACRGTGLVPTHETFRDAMDRLQALREAMDRPLFVTSGYRTPAYNRHVDGAPRSQHRLGRAFDIATFGLDAARLEALAREYGFRGIGRYQRFLHIDTRPRAATWGRPSSP